MPSRDLTFPRRRQGLGVQGYKGFTHGETDLSRLLVLFSRIIVFLRALATECPSDEGQALTFLFPEALAP